MWIGVCVCVCWEKRNQATSPGETDWGSYPMLFMKESCLPLSDLSVSLPPMPSSLSLLFILIFFFSLTSTHPSSTLSCISFIWLSISFLRIYQDFTLNWFPPSLRTCPWHLWWNWNSCLMAKTGALTHDLSFASNEITPESFALEDELMRRVNNLCAFINDDMKSDWWATERCCFLLTSINKGKFSQQWLWRFSWLLQAIISLWHDLTPFRTKAAAALQHHSAISAPRLTLKKGMSLFNLSPSALNLLIVLPWWRWGVCSHSLVWRQIGSSWPLCRQWTIKDTLNLRQEKCVCVIVCKYVDHCLSVVPFMEGAEG